MQEEILQPIKLIYLVEKNSSLIKAETSTINQMLAKYKFYRAISALSLNIIFINDIKRIRRKIGIPDIGIHFQEYVSWYETKTSKHNNTDIFDKAFKASFQINKKFQFYKNPHTSSLFDILDESQSILLANVIILKNKPDLTIYGEKLEQGGISLNISEPISKKQLIDFINKNWKEISTSLKKIPADDKFSIQKRDLEIFELRTFKKLKFREIADYLENSYPNKTVDEDLVKRACHVTKSKIESLYK